jgi:hypothetical protein
MKLKKLKKSKHMLAEIQILKLSYKKKLFDLKTTPKSTEILLNKIANVIYKYHVLGNKILFLGFPKSFSNILINTKHVLIPEFMWFQGMFKNNTTSRNLKNEKAKIPKDLSKLTLKLKKKANLIIMYDFMDSAPVIKESCLAQIPIITINKTLDIFNNRHIYNSTGSYDFLFERTENTLFFFSFIKTVLAKAKHTRNVYKKRPERTLLPQATFVKKGSTGR